LSAHQFHQTYLTSPYETAIYMPNDLSVVIPELFTNYFGRPFRNYRMWIIH